MSSNRNQTQLQLLCDVSRALIKLPVIARNSDWFIALFNPVEIGQRNYFGIGFSTVV